MSSFISNLFKSNLLNYFGLMSHVIIELYIDIMPNADYGSILPVH